MRKSGRSFKETVNEALRVDCSLARRPVLGLKPGYNVDKTWEWIEEIEGPYYE